MRGVEAALGCSVNSGNSINVGRSILITVSNIPFRISHYGIINAFTETKIIFGIPRINKYVNQTALAVSAT